MQRIFLAQLELHIEHSVLRMFNRPQRAVCGNKAQPDGVPLLGEFLNVVRLRNAIRSEPLYGFELAGPVTGQVLTAQDKK